MTGFLQNDVLLGKARQAFNHRPPGQTAQRESRLGARVRFRRQ